MPQRFPARAWLSAVGIRVSDDAVSVKLSSRLECVSTNCARVRTRFVFTHVSELTSSVKCPKWTVVLIVKLCEGARKRGNSFLDFFNFLFYFFFDFYF